MKATTPPTGAGFEVRIADSGERFACHPGENILKAMERLNRKGIPVGCRGGGCGVCKVRIVTGSCGARRMSRAHVTEAEEKAGFGLACCLLPTSDVAVEAVGLTSKCVVPRADHQSRT